MTMTTTTTCFGSFSSMLILISTFLLLPQIPVVFAADPPTFPPTLSPSTAPIVPQPQITTTTTPPPTPSEQPSPKPTFGPTLPPSFPPPPTFIPTMEPSKTPKQIDTKKPSFFPTFSPTDQPTKQPTPRPTGRPSFPPTTKPTRLPTRFPTNVPTHLPTTSQPTRWPSFGPTELPTDVPTAFPTTSLPSQKPSPKPSTLVPSEMPSTNTPTRMPSTIFPTPLNVLTLNGQVVVKLNVVSSTMSNSTSDNFSATAKEFLTSLFASQELDPIKITDVNVVNQKLTVGRRKRTRERQRRLEEGEGGELEVELLVKGTVGQSPTFPKADLVKFNTSLKNFFSVQSRQFLVLLKNNGNFSEEDQEYFETVNSIQGIYVAPNNNNNKGDIGGGQEENDNGDKNVALIIGASLGALAVVAIAAALGTNYYYTRRQQQQQRKEVKTSSLSRTKSGGNDDHDDYNVTSNNNQVVGARPRDNTGSSSSRGGSGSGSGRDANNNNKSSLKLWKNKSKRKKSSSCYYSSNSSTADRELATDGSILEAPDDSTFGGGGDGASYAYSMDHGIAPSVVSGAASSAYGGSEYSTSSVGTGMMSDGEQQQLPVTPTSLQKSSSQRGGGNYNDYDESYEVDLTSYGIPPRSSSKGETTSYTTKGDNATTTTTTTAPAAAALAFEPVGLEKKQSDEQDKGIKLRASLSKEEEEAAEQFSEHIVPAPKGKLGVVIDTTKEGPVIFQIKSGSSVTGMLFKGDKIVKVDGIVTKNMTASAVTQIMAKRMDQERKITVLRR